MAGLRAVYGGCLVCGLAVRPNGAARNQVHPQAQKIIVRGTAYEAESSRNSKTEEVPIHNATLISLCDPKHYASGIEAKDRPTCICDILCDSQGRGGRG